MLWDILKTQKQVVARELEMSRIQSHIKLAMALLFFVPVFSGQTWLETQKWALTLRKKALTDLLQFFCEDLEEGSLILKKSARNLHCFSFHCFLIFVCLSHQAGSCGIDVMRPVTVKERKIYYRKELSSQECGAHLCCGCFSSDLSLLFPQLWKVYSRTG